MIICISGLTGSGKNAVGAEVAGLLSLRVVDPTFKAIARKQGMALMDFQKKAEKEHSIDRRFDARLAADAKRGDCVVTTWLGPWMVKRADLRVWLHAPREVRARRLMGRDGMGMDEAVKHITERDESNHLRYREIYGINIYDHSNFELVINTERFAPAQSAQVIAAAAMALGRKMKSAPGRKVRAAKKKARAGKKKRKR